MTYLNNMRFLSNSHFKLPEKRTNGNEINEETKPLENQYGNNTKNNIQNNVNLENRSSGINGNGTSISALKNFRVAPKTYTYMKDELLQMGFTENDLKKYFNATWITYTSSTGIVVEQGNKDEYSCMLPQIIEGRTIKTIEELLDFVSSTNLDNIIKMLESGEISWNDLENKLAEIGAKNLSRYTDECGRENITFELNGKQHGVTNHGY